MAVWKTDDIPWFDATCCESDREYNVRGALLQDARNRFPAIIATIDSHHSRSVRALQQSLQRRTPGCANPLSVLDLDKFVIGLAYRLNETRIFDALMTDNACGVDITKAKDPSFTIDHGLRLADHITCAGVGFKPAMGFARGWLTTGAVNYIVPHLDYGRPLIRNFTAQQNAVFTDFHEGYHYLDPYFATADRFLDNSSVYVPDARALLDDPSYAVRVGLTYKSECFADMGALSEMIRRGDDLDIVDTCADHRERETDFGHRTAPLLQIFKTNVIMSGLAHFRALPEEAVVPFCGQIIMDHAPTSAQLKQAARLALTSDACDTASVSATPVAFEQALAIAPYLVTGPFVTNPFRIVSERSGPVRPIDRLDGQIDRAATELIERAYDLGGCVTPETVAHGFIAGLDARRSKRADDPHDPTLVDSMIYLQTAFLERPVAYMMENTKRGLHMSHDRNGVPVFKP